MNKTLIICGPTASGKTALARRLAKKFNGELVSADSRQIYRGMDIGTGKDVSGRSKIKGKGLKIKLKNQTYELIPYDLDGVLLWLCDVVDPQEEFSVAQYQLLASAVIRDIRKRGKLPIGVGGTGLYIKSLISPIETSHIPPNKNLRKYLYNFSVSHLQTILRKNDPAVLEAMNQSDCQNPRRLIRKIEITGYLMHKNVKVVQDQKINEDRLLIGLTAPHPFLYKRIDARVDKRIKEGIIGEIQTLLKRGYTWDLPSMNTFGYKEWKDYIISSHTTSLLPHVIERWKWDEHGYARRQMTWFKKMKGIEWVDIVKEDWQQTVEVKVAKWYTVDICCPK